MAFRFVRSAGSVHEPAVLQINTSGVVRPGMVVELSRTGGTGVQVAASGGRITSVFGVCLDYAQGASDAQVRVVPFVPGQIWEADCVNTVVTGQIGLKHALSGAAAEIGTYLLNTNYDNTSASGVFLVYAVTQTTGSGKVIGEFMRMPSGVHQAGIAGEVYF